MLLKSPLMFITVPLFTVSFPLLVKPVTSGWIINGLARAKETRTALATNTTILVFEEAYPALQEHIGGALIECDDGIFPTAMAIGELALLLRSGNGPAD